MAKAAIAHSFILALDFYYAMNMPICKIYTWTIKKKIKFAFNIFPQKHT